MYLCIYMQKQIFCSIWTELLLEAMRYHLLPEQRGQPSLSSDRTQERKPDGIRPYIFAIGKLCIHNPNIRNGSECSSISIIQSFLCSVLLLYIYAGGGSLFAIHSESECYNTRYTIHVDHELCMYITYWLFIRFFRMYFHFNRTDRWCNVAPLVTRRYTYISKYILPHWTLFCNEEEDSLHLFILLFLQITFSRSRCGVAGEGGKIFAVGG
jgi:hypothetical protein